MINVPAIRSSDCALGMRCAVMLALLLSVAGKVSAQSCAPGMLSIWGPDGYVGVADSPGLRVTSAFTIECWAKLDGPNRQAALIDKGHGSISNYGLFVDSGKIIGRLQQNSGVRLQYVITDPGSWHHYALSFAAGDSAYLYVDGVEVGSTPVSTASIATNSDSLRIGRSAAGVSFSGDIDEVRIWNVTRSAAAISSKLTTSLTGTESGLIAYYPLDDDPGSTRIHDFSNHQLGGVLHGTSTEIGVSSSPITRPTAGFRLDAMEKTMDLGTRRCNPSFDTVIHVRNLGTSSLLVNSVAPFRGQAFSVTTDLPFTLPADSTKYFAIKIHFSANGGGSYNDSLYISSADNCGGTLHIGLHAVYDSVGLIATPSTISVGSKLQCEYPVLVSATVRNVSTTDSAKIVGIAIPSGSGISLVTPLPISLAAGEQRTIAIRIDSSNRGPFSVGLTLALDKCSREALLNVFGYRSRAEFGVPSSIDFGVQNATLNGVTRDTVVTVTNTGDRGMQILGFTTTDASLRVTEPRAPLFLNSGDTMQVHVEFTADHCGLNEAKLHVRGFYCGFDTAVSVRMTLRSPEQLLTRAVNVGVTCNFVDTTLWIANQNATAMKVDTMTFDQDAVFFVRPFTFPITVAPHDSARIDIRFNPGTNGDYRVTGYLFAEPCSVTPVGLVGAKGINGVQFGNGRLEFGRGCDASSMTKVAVLRNTSPRTVTITDTLYFGSKRFRVDPVRLPLVLAAGATASFTVHYAPTLGALDTGRFSLIAQEGCLAADLRLTGSRERPLIATLEQSLDFGTVCTGVSAFRTLHLENAGIDSVDIATATATGPFAVVRAPKIIASGKTDSLLIRFSPTSTLTATGRLKIPIGSCGDTLDVELTGSGGPLPALITSLDTLDFGNVRLGDSAVRCLTISNASCTPLLLHGADYRVDGVDFHLSSLPEIDTVSRGRSTFICVTFAPTSRAATSGTLWLTDGQGDSVQVVLRGTGVAPLLRLVPTSLDFGYVLHGDHHTLSVYARNVGNATAHLSYAASAPDFHVTGPDSLIAGASDSLHVDFAPGVNTTSIHALAFVSYDELQDTIELAGQGSERGLQLSAVEADFGSVHVDRDSTTMIAVTALIDYPTITSINTTPGTTSFSVSSAATLPHTLSDKDTVWLRITYHPTAEKQDGSAIVIITDRGQSTIAMSGTGVSEHIAVNATSIDVGDVELGKSLTVPRITIRNPGGYPLTLLGTTTRTFSAEPDVTGALIAPSGSLTLDITFAPTRARRIVDTLAIASSAPEGTQYVTLIGRGVYPVESRPRFSYTIASAAVRSGDRVTIPVTIDGSFIDHLDADSTVLSIAFDPTMLRVLSVTAPQLRYWRVVNDTVLHVALNGVPSAPSQLLSITTEALLGTHPVSYLRVIDADPRADNAPLGVDGVFTVTDCDGNLHGVGFVGDYALKQSMPNPATSTATLAYTLGLTGPVSMVLYNEVGQLVKVLNLGEQHAGEHTLTLDLTVFPAGRYTYRLQSLEYHAEGTLVIVR